MRLQSLKQQNGKEEIGEWINEEGGHCLLINQFQKKGGEWARRATNGGRIKVGQRAKSAGKLFNLFCFSYSSHRLPSVSFSEACRGALLCVIVQAQKA